jgi:hypothetical protein
MSTPGSKLQTATLKKLTEAGLFCWRQNNQSTYDPKMNSGRGGYRSHAGLKGVPDIICILQPNGTFCGIEIKAGKDKVSPDQKLFERRAKNNGAKYYVIKTLAEVDNFLLTL